MCARCFDGRASRFYPALVLVLTACSATETGNPPSFTLDGASLLYEMSVSDPTVRIDLPSGTAPSGADWTLVVSPLDEGFEGAVGPVSSMATADGSFSLTLPATNGSAFRFSMRDGGLRSEPIDVELAVGPPARFTPLAGPSDCLDGIGLTEAPYDADGIVEVEVLNRCITAVTVSPSTIFGRPTLPDDFAIEPMERAVLVFQRDDNAAPGSEDLIRITLTGGAVGEAHISLYELD